MHLDATVSETSSASQPAGLIKDIEKYPRSNPLPSHNYRKLENLVFSNRGSGSKNSTEWTPRSHSARQQ